MMLSALFLCFGWASGPTGIVNDIPAVESIVFIGLCEITEGHVSMIPVISNKWSRLPQDPLIFKTRDIGTPRDVLFQ